MAEGDAARDLHVGWCAVGPTVAVSIGRVSDVLPVVHPFVSSRHCTAILNAGRLVLKDSSLNGTYVNGTKLPPKGEAILNIGDVVGIPIELERTIFFSLRGRD